VRHGFGLLAAVTARGVAILVGLVSFVGVIGELRGAASDLGLWLVDVRDVDPIVARLTLAAIGVCLVAWAVARSPGRIQRGAAFAACLVLEGLALRDTFRYSGLVASGTIRASSPVPWSLVLALLATVVAVGIVGRRGHGLEPLRPSNARLATVVAVGVATILFPIAQIACFGSTDYRRPAEAAIVFGARVYANGQPSPLLADRIATGVALYREGLVPVLVMSGGDGADGWNEAAVMRDVAISAGVPAAAVLVDRAGVNTDATVANTIGLVAEPARPRSEIRLIAVSQAYHLPRIQLAFSQAGIDVLTVPAVDPVPIEEMPLLVAREVPAFWLYYLRVCLGP
jgi:vancomycin permeability regulator SanA